MNGHVSMDELNSLPAKDKTDSDNDYNLKDDEKIQISRRISHYVRFDIILFATLLGSEDSRSWNI